MPGPVPHNQTLLLNISGTKFDLIFILAFEIFFDALQIQCDIIRVAESEEGGFLGTVGIGIGVGLSYSTTMSIIAQKNCNFI